MQKVDLMQLTRTFWTLSQERQQQRWVVLELLFAGKTNIFATFSFPSEHLYGHDFFIRKISGVQVKTEISFFVEGHILHIGIEICDIIVNPFNQNSEK